MSRRERASKGARSPRADYLRALRGDVDAALALIIHDVIATGAMTHDHAGAAVRIRAAEHQEDLGSLGFEISAAEVAVWVAEAIQEDLIEGFGSGRRLVVWPACPDHPDHPLWLRRTDERVDSQAGDDPAWTCPTTHRRIAELGAL